MNDRAIEVGDVVVAQGGFILHCGSGIYDCAICISVDPLILVSVETDMRWSTTITTSDVKSLCKADPDIVEKCMRRRLK